MKKLNLTAVATMTDLLIHTNGSTTTLDVKNALRELGYFAEQTVVSEMMNELYDNSGNYTRDNSQTNYFVYSWTINHELIVGGYAEDYDETTDATPTTNASNTASSSLSNAHTNFQSAVASGSVGTPVSREPEHIYYIESHARNHQGNDKAWVVSHANGNNEVHIYNENLTRDNVRSKYASMNNCKIQDVRARRLSNF